MDLVGKRVLVLGLGETGLSMARWIARQGGAVRVADTRDAPPALGGLRAAVPQAEIVTGPFTDALLGGADLVAASPGVSLSDPVVRTALERGFEVVGDVELFARFLATLPGAQRGRVIAVTGTNGKTTVTAMVAAMLEESGVRTAAVGNLEVPLVAAIEDPTPECFVVEASSFRLGHSRHFSPQVAVWLNFAPDHLDVHTDLETYRRAKARIWAEQVEGQTAIVNLDDPVVAAAAPHRPGVRSWRFGIGAEARAGGAEFTERAGLLVGADGEVLAARKDLWRTLPHDRSNALAAAATALAGGAEIGAVSKVLAEFPGLPHRVQLVGESMGVRWYDDSKSTAPHATLAALSGFDRVVLVAGGRNKGLDLTELGTASNVVAVVGIGESAEEVLASFPALPGCTASSMSEAVRSAAGLARRGDVVLLSPGCASFDWYSSYEERGDDFSATVDRMILEGQR